MTKKYFNFNHETDLTPFELHEDGTVEFTLNDETATFDSIKEFAEFYAQARNVLPENLKNWTLIENPEENMYAFVLKAGTAGLDQELNDFIESLNRLGYTPQEIGEAVKAYQQNNSTVSMTDKQLEQILDEEINKYTGWKKAYLKDKLEDIKDYFPLDDPDEDDYEEFMDMHGYESFDIQKFKTDESYARECISNILFDWVDRKKSELTYEIYPNSYDSEVPVEILYDIDEEDFPTWDKQIDHYASLEKAESILKQRVVSHKIANRGLTVKFKVVLNEDYPNTLDSFYIENDEKDFKLDDTRDFKQEFKDYIRDVKDNYGFSPECKHVLYYIEDQFYILLDAY